MFYSRIVDAKNVFLKKLCLKRKEGMLAKRLFDMPHCGLALVRSSNQEFVYYQFYKNSIVSYTIVAVEETLNLALDTTFHLGTSNCPG